MKENEIRKQVAAKAASFVGVKEGTAQHHAIIDGYNAHKPLARGYAVKYNDAWCATFASYIAILLGHTDIVPTECGCNKQIEAFQTMGRWCENDAKKPEPGDYIFYDWDDNGVGDNTGSADHVGIVESVNGNSFTVIEGNKSNAVGRRTMEVNGRYIRGYGVPDYARKATEPAGEPEKQPESAADEEFSLGEIVNFTGSKHYTSSNATDAKSCKSGKARITQKYNGKHPYHVVREGNDGCTVWGWVDAADLEHIKAAADAGRTYTVKKNDTLWGIAASQLGDGTRYNEIKTLNGLATNLIYAGTVLKLPN